VKARKVKGLDPRAPLRESVARTVLVRLDELRSFAPAALEPGASRDQHDMRIAAKRLRYVLEATGFCLGEPAENARKGARKLQGLLGELHDCDVMLPRVDRHLAGLRDADAAAVLSRAGDAEDLEPALAARAPHRTSYRGLEVLSVFAEARRRLLFERFALCWKRESTAGTWDDLEQAAAGVL
jgi:CHAD domain-containing protein